MKHGSITTHQRPRSSRKNGWKLVEVHGSVWKRNNRLTKWRWLFFGICIGCIGYLEKGKRITAQYYSELLDRFDAAIKAKRLHSTLKNILFNQDNAPAHKAVKTMTKLTELKYELLPRHAHFPDLATYDYYLFPNLKRWLASKRFYSNEKVSAETNAYFDELGAECNKEGIGLLNLAVQYINAQVFFNNLVFVTS